MLTSSIVVYITSRDVNKENELRTIINCISASIIDRLFVIDNSPTDQLKSFIESQSDKIEYIFSNKNLGYGAAHNIALRRAISEKSDYHVVLNSDIYFEKGTIETLKKYMDDDRSIGSVMPMVKYPDGEIQYLCKLQPTPIDLIGRRFIPTKLFSSRNTKYELRHSGYDKVMNVPCLSGCFMFLRTDILSEIGIFDEDFFMYCEDFDLYKRIHKKYKTVFFPAVSIVHSHKKESYKSSAMFWCHIKSALHYFNKWGWFFDGERRRVNKRILKEIG